MDPRGGIAGIAGIAGVAALVLVSACGSSAATSVAPAPSPSSTPTTAPTTAPVTTPATTAPATATPVPTATSTATATLSSGARSATCVNGWIQPAPGSDFYKQASAALDQAEGGTGYVIRSVRYFAGPLAAGGIGAIYYLDVSDPRLTSRVLLVSGAGPASVALAKPGTTGWTPSQWTAPGGVPTTLQLSPSVAGCLAGT